MPCFACVSVRARCLPAVPIAMQQGALCFALAGAVGCARGYDGASKLEGWLRRTSVQFARGRACVQGVGGWCVNRDLSVTREVWTGQEKGEERQGCELSSAVQCFRGYCYYCYQNHPRCAHTIRGDINKNIINNGYLRTSAQNDDGASSHRTDGRSDQISRRRDETRLVRASRHTDRPSSGLQVVTRLERDGMSRVGESDVSALLSALCSLSPVACACASAAAAAAALLLALPRRRLSSTAASDQIRAGGRGARLFG